MIWFLPVLLIGLFGYGIYRVKHNDLDMGGIFACLVGGLALTTCLIILPMLTVSNGAECAEMTMFYETNTINYEYAVSETASYLSEEEFADRFITGSLEKMEQAGYVSNRISEWINAVNQYNTQLASMSYYNNTLLFGVLYPNEINNLKPMVIK